MGRRRPEKPTRLKKIRSPRFVVISLEEIDLEPYVGNGSSDSHPKLGSIEPFKNVHLVNVCVSLHN